MGWGGFGASSGVGSSGDGSALLLCWGSLGCARAHPPLSGLCQPCSDPLLQESAGCCARREGRDGSLCEAELCWEQRQLERGGRDFLCRLSLAAVTPPCETFHSLAGGRNRCGRGVTESKGDSGTGRARPVTRDREGRGEGGTGSLGTVCDRGGAAEMGEMRRRAWGGHPELCAGHRCPLCHLQLLCTPWARPFQQAQPSLPCLPRAQPSLHSLCYDPSKVW